MRNIFKRLFAVLLLTTVMLSGLPMMAQAAENSSSITLRKPDDGKLAAFRVPNLFPGEHITKEYIIETRHSEEATLYFHADIRPDDRYKKLAEVLKVKIELPGEKEVVYEGLMAGMPNALTHPLPAGTNQTTYRITVFLDPSVGNDYRNKELMADFRWWFLDETEKPVTIVAEKTMNGQYARGSKFRFQLKDETGTVVRTAQNDDGHIEFDALYFADPGTYVFTLTEVKGSNPRVIYDDDSYTATIVVAGDGSYDITWTENGKAYEYQIPQFQNATKGSTLPDHSSPDNPKTGDPVPVKLLSIVCISALCALICLFLLWKNRKEEDGK